MRLRYTPDSRKAMGKKDPTGAKKRRREEEEAERAATADMDPEFVAEMRALSESRASVSEGAHDADYARENPSKYKSQDSVHIYNKKALLAKAEEIALNLDFPQTLAVVSEAPISDSLKNPDDDLARESAFYDQAMAAVVIGRKKLDDMGFPYLRPDDYYAEMVKDDGHMQRIRDSLLFEERKMDAFERRKKNEAHKKFGKQLNAEKIKNKAAEKRAAVDAISQIRKRRKNNSEFDIDLEVDRATRTSSTYRGVGGNAKKEKGGNRGADQYSEYKTPQSNASRSTGSRGAGPSRGKGGKGTKKQRPGKAARRNGRR